MSTKFKFKKCEFVFNSEIESPPPTTKNDMEMYEDDIEIDEDLADEDEMDEETAKKLYGLVGKRFIKKSNY